MREKLKIQPFKIWEEYSKTLIFRICAFLKTVSNYSNRKDERKLKKTRKRLFLEADISNSNFTFVVCLSVTSFVPFPNG